VGGDGEGSVLRTGGEKFAAAGTERMNGRGNPTAVEVEEIEQNASHHLRWGYSKIRVAAPRGTSFKWLFPQEKAAFETIIKGTFILVLL
jgi:hypothetical protein